MIVTVLVTVGLVILIPWADSDLRLSVHWLPGTGKMTVGLGATGLWMALITTGACVFALWSEYTVQSPVRAGTWTMALTLLSLAAAQVAFLAEHFLARYVALEIVALCVSLAPLAELHLVRDQRTGERTAGGLARMVYLILRLGDIGLLIAISILWSAGGTLDIAPALEAGKALDTAYLNWVVTGLVVAVWIKVGGWPFHIWQQAGKSLSHFTHSWVYATLMPNLGFYLLYRITPLLTQAGAVQRIVYGIGAVGAALGAIMALVTTRSGMRSALVYLGVSLGGLALVLSAAGLKTVVWMTALFLTPVRLAFYLVDGTAQDISSASPEGRRSPRQALRAGLCALSGLSLTVYCLLCTWWMRQSGAPLGALLITEFSVATIAIWSMRSTWQLWRLPGEQGSLTDGITASHPTQRQATQAVLPRNLLDWQELVLTLLGVIVLAAMLFFGPVTRYLAIQAHSSPLPLPSALVLMRYLATAPAFWVAIVLAVAIWRLRLRARQTASDTAESAAINLDEGLAQAARVLSAVIEVGIQERILGSIVRVGIGTARATRRVLEQQILEGATTRVAEAALGSGRLAYRVLEEQSLEGLLRGTVRSVLAAGRGMQRWHTGRLRRNLLWIGVSLLLAIAAMALYG
jgi:formate hydrogenlyase subunit 3/multisubunit Na+/H+ antiporter MnhD subunit